MKTIIRTAIAVAALSAASFGLAGPALAAPLNDPDGICRYHDDHGNCAFGTGAPSRDVDITIPANDPQEQAIVDYVTGIERDFYADTSTGAIDDPKPMQELKITTTPYTSGTAPGDIQTSVLTVYANKGGPYPNTYYKGFSFDNATKAPITFDTLFRPGSQPLNVIVPIVQDAVSREAGEPVPLDPSIAFDPANYQDFAITNDAVIFFFGTHQLQAAFPDIQVSVPRDAIASDLTPGL
jgi:hypothetical protein